MGCSLQNTVISKIFDWASAIRLERELRKAVHWELKYTFMHFIDMTEGDFLSRENQEMYEKFLDNRWSCGCMLHNQNAFIESRILFEQPPIAFNKELYLQMLQAFGDRDHKHIYKFYKQVIGEQDSDAE